MSVDEQLAYVRTVPLPDGVRVPEGIRMDKLLARVGLAPSVSEGVRKLKAGAVEVNADRIMELILKDAPGELVVQVGRNWRRVTL